MLQALACRFPADLQLRLHIVGYVRDVWLKLILILPMLDLVHKFASFSLSFNLIDGAWQCLSIVLRHKRGQVVHELVVDALDLLLWPHVLQVWSSI